MSDRPFFPVFPEKIAPAQRETMEHLLSSKTFASSPRLRAVLQYLLRSLEAGTSEAITEQSIGQTVFGRTEGYNAAEDNIVRVTLRHLRTRLEKYYQSEGQNEPLLLDIPKGKYIPVFHPRETPEAPIPEPETVPPIASATEAAFEEPIARPPGSVIRNRLSQPFPARRWLWSSAAVLLAALAFWAGYATRPGVVPTGTGKAGILGSLCNKANRLLVVVVDTNLQIYRSVFGKQVLLQDYIKHQYGNEPLATNDPRMATVIGMATDSNETNISSTILAVAVRRELPHFNLEVKHPHSVSIRDFQSEGSVVLLGGPWSDPWGQLFEGRLNFRLLPLPTVPSLSEIHNTNPQPGEATDFVPHRDGIQSVNYVRIAILPNYSNTGYVFLVGATSTEALEAGGQFLLSDQSLSLLKSQLHLQDLSTHLPLELVLEVRGFDSVPGSAHIVAKRFRKSS